MNDMVKIYYFPCKSGGLISSGMQTIYAMLGEFSGVTTVHESSKEVDYGSIDLCSYPGVITCFPELGTTILSRNV